MMTRQLRYLGTLLTALCATSCGDDDVVCIVPPCLAPVAATISVIPSTGGAIAGAFVISGSNTIPCAQSPGATCYVPGGGGTYQLDVGAPGFTTVHRTITVTSTTPKCGCEQVNLQHLDVTLVPL